MKKIALAVAVAAALALTACSSTGYKSPDEKFPNCVGCYTGGD